MKIFIRLITAVALLGLVACEEKVALININKDGSGSVTVRQYKNAEAAAGLLGGLGAGFGGGEEVEQPDPVEEIKKEVTAMGDAMGEVEQGVGKEVTNKHGWKGYEMVWEFKDVNKVMLNLDGGGDSEDLDLPEGEEAPEDEGVYKFTFTPGDVAKLEISANMPAEEGGEAEPVDADAAAAKAQQEQMMAMMGPMLKGMRMSMLVKVNGEITETNADIVAGKGKNVIVLMDAQMDKAMANPKLKDMMGKFQDGPPSKTINEDGLKFQHMAEDIVVEFK